MYTHTYTSTSVYTQLHVNTSMSIHIWKYICGGKTGGFKQYL